MLNNKTFRYYNINRLRSNTFIKSLQEKTNSNIRTLAEKIVISKILLRITIQPQGQPKEKLHKIFQRYIIVNT